MRGGDEMLNNFFDASGGLKGSISRNGNNTYVKNNIGNLIGVYDHSAKLLKDASGRIIAKGSEEIIGMFFGRK